MKNIVFTTLILFLIIGCNSKIEYDSDTIKFNIRKYLFVEDLIDYKDIENVNIDIDSIIKYPKYRYIETELNDTRKAYNGLINSKNEVTNLVLKILQNEIDSLNIFYKNIDKSINFHKCYYKIKYKSDSARNTVFTLILNEEFTVVDYIMDIGQIENINAPIDILISDTIKHN